MAHGAKYTQRDGYDRCDYCGSITPAEALRRMTAPGCGFSGTDKGGYKFYFDDEKKDFGKFYGEHLDELSEGALREFAAASRRCLGVDWVYVAGKAPKWSAPRVSGFYGWQTWGKVGPDGAPVFGDGAPVPPDEAWWTK